MVSENTLTSKLPDNTELPVKIDWLTVFWVVLFQKSI